MRTILIFDEIGWGGITAQMIARELEFANGDDIEVRVNSPGGDVFEGIAIYNMFNQYSGAVKVVVDGLAASIASIIALGGDEVVMNEGSFFMIHNPWSGAMGEANDFRKQADVLDAIRDQLLGIYKKATNLSEEEIVSMMDEETWLNAEQSIEMGFATSQETFIKVAASLNFSNKTRYFFNNTPTELTQMKKKLEVIHNEVAEAELAEVETEETALEELENEIEESEEFAELEFVAEAELEEELEESEEVAEQEEELEEEFEDEITYTEEEVMARIEIALEEEADRQEQIRNMAFPGQEELVAELIKDKAEIVDASLRIITNAKELSLHAKSEDVSKGNALNKLLNAAPKSLDSKEEEVSDLDSLRAKASKETDPKAKRELIRQINKLKKA